MSTLPHRFAKRCAFLRTERLLGNASACDCALHCAMLGISRRCHTHRTRYDFSAALLRRCAPCCRSQGATAASLALANVALAAATDEAVVVSWPGANLDDPRIPQLAEALKETEYFQDALTGQCLPVRSRKEGTSK